MLPDPLQCQECLQAFLHGTELCCSTGASPRAKTFTFMILDEPLVATMDITWGAAGMKGARAGQCPLPQGSKTGEHQGEHPCPVPEVIWEKMFCLLLAGSRQRPLPPSNCPLLVPLAGQQRRNRTSRTPRRNRLSWPSRAHRTPRAARAPRPPRTTRARLRGWICEWSLQ